MKHYWITDHDQGEQMRPSDRMPGRPGQRHRWRLSARLGLAAIFTALLSSCGTPQTLEMSLRSPDPQVKILALIRVGEEDRKDLFPEVLSNLHSKDETVRFLSGVVARKLSGQDVDFKPFASASEQQAAIERWRLWWEQMNAENSLESTPPAAVSIHKDYRESIQRD